MNEKTIYKNPPIVERIVGVYADINPELFEAKMPDWAAKIKDVYPLARPITEWSLNFKEVNGIPMLQNAMPKAEIIQMFWKPHPKKLAVQAMRLRPNRLVFHLHREEGKLHDFEELYVEMEAWIDKWMEHFEVPSLKGVTVEYVNRLNGAITPQFMLSDGRLKISEAFILFSNVPGKYTGITTPYDCKMRLIVDEKRPCHFDLRVRAEDQASTGVRIQFVANTIGAVGQGKAIAAAESLGEIRFCHEVMLEQFDCFFTEKAKNSFA
jgi:hypothetical protein